LPKRVAAVAAVVPAAGQLRRAAEAAAQRPARPQRAMWLRLTFRPVWLAHRLAAPLLLALDVEPVVAPRPAVVAAEQAAAVAVRLRRRSSAGLLAPCA